MPFYGSSGSNGQQILIAIYSSFYGYNNYRQLYCIEALLLPILWEALVNFPIQKFPGKRQFHHMIVQYDIW